MTTLGNTIKYLTGLTILGINDNEVKDDGMMKLFENISCLKQLEKLDAGLCNVNLESIKIFSESIKQCKMIKELGLSCNIINDEALEILSNSFNELKYLEIIYLSKNDISNNGVIALGKNLKYIPYLKELYLGMNKIGDDGFKVFCENLKEVTQLEVLAIDCIYYYNFIDNDIGDVGFANLRLAMGKLKELKELWIKGINILLI